MPSKRTPWNKLPPIDPRPCERCGKPFVPDRSNIKTARYCGNKCRLDAMHDSNRVVQRNRIEVHCASCGKPMLLTPSRVAANKTHTCSRECMATIKRKLTGADHFLYKAKVPMPCEVCGTVRLVKPSLVSRYRACSRRCAAILSLESSPRTSSLEVAVSTELTRRGEHFISQHRIAWYVVDFFLPDRNLVIEADGSYWHSLPNMVRIDKAKNGYMASHGIAIARISEQAIRDDVQAAVEFALATRHLTASTE